MRTTYRILQLLGLAFFLIGANPLKGFYLKIVELRPGQTHLGVKSVLQIVTEDTDEAARERQTPMGFLMGKFVDDPLPVVRAPDKKFILLDGHHRTTSLWIMYQRALRDYENAHKAWRSTGQKGPEPQMPEVPQIKAVLKGDFHKDKDWSRITKFLIENHKVYFGKDVCTGKSDEEKVRTCLPRTFEIQADGRPEPPDFEGLRNRPLRTTIGDVLFDLGLASKNAGNGKFDGAKMAEYLEFLIADELEARGVTVVSGTESTAEVRNRIEDLIFDCADMMAFLKEHYRVEKDAAATQTNKEYAESILTTLSKIHQSQRGGRPAPDCVLRPEPGK